METEPMRDLGINMTQTTMANYALVKGYKTAWESMDEATKQQLRLNFMVEKAGFIIGDAQRTIGNYANQIKVMKANFTDLGREIGNVTMPVLNSFVETINSIFKATKVKDTGLLKALTEDLMNLKQKTVLTNEEKARIETTIAILQKQYPGYLQNINLEKATYSELTLALKAYNTELKNKKTIATDTKEYEKLNAQIKTQTKIRDEAYADLLKISTRSIKKGEADIFSPKAGYNVMQVSTQQTKYESAVKRIIELTDKLNQNLIQIAKQEKKTLDDIVATTITASEAYIKADPSSDRKKLHADRLTAYDEAIDKVKEYQKTHKDSTMAQMTLEDLYLKKQTAIAERTTYLAGLKKESYTEREQIDDKLKLAETEYQINKDKLEYQGKLNTLLLEAKKISTKTLQDENDKKQLIADIKLKQQQLNETKLKTNKEISDDEFRLAEKIYENSQKRQEDLDTFSKAYDNYIEKIGKEISETEKSIFLEEKKKKIREEQEKLNKNVITELDIATAKQASYYQAMGEKIIKQKEEELELEKNIAKTKEEGFSNALKKQSDYWEAYSKKMMEVYGGKLPKTKTKDTTEEEKKALDELIGSAFNLAKTFDDTNVDKLVSGLESAYKLVDTIGKEMSQEGGLDTESILNIANGVLGAVTTAVNIYQDILNESIEASNTLAETALTNITDTIQTAQDSVSGSVTSYKKLMEEVNQMGVDETALTKYKAGGFLGLEMVVDTEATQQAIDEATQAIKDAGEAAKDSLMGILGLTETTAQDLLQNALSDLNLDDFETSWEEMVYNATMKALVYSDVMASLTTELNEKIITAVADGIITAAELADIDVTGGKIKEQGQVIVDILEQLGFSFDTLNQTVQSTNSGMYNLAEGVKLKTYAYYAPTAQTSNNYQVGVNVNSTVSETQLARSLARATARTSRAKAGVL